MQSLRPSNHLSGCVLTECAVFLPILPLQTCFMPVLEAFWLYLDSYSVESPQHPQHLEHKKVHMAVSLSDRQLRGAVKVFAYAKVISVLSVLNTETMPTLQNEAWTYLYVLKENNFRGVDTWSFSQKSPLFTDYRMEITFIESGIRHNKLGHLNVFHVIYKIVWGRNHSYFQVRKLKIKAKNFSPRSQQGYEN